MVKRRLPYIELVADADGGPRKRRTVLADGALPVRCPVCTEFFGIQIHARITMLPTLARRTVDGRLSLDECKLVCSQCLTRNVKTYF